MIWCGIAAQNRLIRPAANVTLAPPIGYVTEPRSSRFISISLCRSGRGIKVGVHRTTVRPYGAKSGREGSKRGIELSLQEVLGVKQAELSLIQNTQSHIRVPRCAIQPPRSLWLLLSGTATSFRMFSWPRPAK